MLTLFVILLCASSRLALGLPVQPPIFFQPLFFYGVPVIEGKRIHREERDVIEAVQGIRRTVRQNVAITFPDSDQPRHEILFPANQGTGSFHGGVVDDRLVLGAVNVPSSSSTPLVQGGSGTFKDQEGSGGELDYLLEGDVGMENETYVGSDSDTNCKLRFALTYYNGSCARLLSDSACQGHQWLVLNEEGLSECVERPCPLGELFYEGRCVQTSDDSVCGASEIMYVDFLGEVYCDCEQGFVYDGIQCEAEHRRGSCPQGEYLEIDSLNRVMCVPNPCSSDEFVQNPKDGECYQKTFAGKCDSQNNDQYELIFDSENLVANCVIFDVRNLFEVPALTSCPPGSKRDVMNRCAEVSRFSFYSVPSQFTARFTLCPPNHIMFPNGSCRKVNGAL